MARTGALLSVFVASDWTEQPAALTVIRHIEIGIFIVATAGLVISLAALIVRWNDQKRKAVEELEKAVKEHEQSMTFEERAKARLALLEQTGIHPVLMSDVLKRNQKDGGTSGVSERLRFFPSGTYWDYFVAIFALLALGAATALML